MRVCAYTYWAFCLFVLYSLNDDEDDDEDEEDDINFFKDSSDEKNECERAGQHQPANEIINAGKFNLHENRRYKINDLQQVRITTETSQNNNFL